MFETKKDQRDVQELCQRLVEQVAEVAGSQLEQKSLLSRNLTVRPGTQTDITQPDSQQQKTGNDVTSLIIRFFLISYCLIKAL